MFLLKRLFSLFAICVFLLVTAGPHAGAQESDALRFFQQNPSRSLFRSEPPVRRVVNRPVRQEPRGNTREGSYVAPRRRAAPSPSPDVAVLPDPEKVVVPVTTFIHVAGDSLAELLAQGLKEHLVDKPEIGIVRRARSSSGIVRDDYYDWNKVLQDLLASPERVDLLAMMIGSNDRQPLRDETGSHEFKSDRWREIYVKRLDGLIELVRAQRIPMIWVGLPIMQSQRLSADILYINGLVRERATRAGMTYVDIWEGFANDQGQYSSSGPDVNGEIVKLRAADGVHFTKAGARKLGFFVSKDVALQLNRERSGSEIAALPSDLSEQIKRDAPGLVPQSLQTSLQLPTELPALPAISERPLAGPTVALTANIQTEGAKLLKGKPLVPVNEMTILVEQALGYGRLPPAKLGRADDFQWPRASGKETRAN
jgi:uncharacterized protein